MTTKLAGTLKRELSIGLTAYTLTLSDDGFTLALKGRRKGLDVRWVDLVSGEAALATALNASLTANIRSPDGRASPKGAKTNIQVPEKEAAPERGKASPERGKTSPAKKATPNGGKADIRTTKKEAAAKGGKANIGSPEKEAAPRGAKVESRPHEKNAAAKGKAAAPRARSRKRGG